MFLVATDNIIDHTLYDYLLKKTAEAKKCNFLIRIVSEPAVWSAPGAMSANEGFNKSCGKYSEITYGWGPAFTST